MERAHTHELQAKGMIGGSLSRAVRSTRGSSALGCQRQFRTHSQAPVGSGIITSTPSAALLSPRLRKSPFYERTLAAGATDFTSYNRMLMPLGYGDPTKEYEALTKGVAIWDVAAERQVEIRGRDAFELAQLCTCRDLTNVKANICAYAVMCDDDGVVINDPVLLKLADDHFWLSIADSDVLLWAKALAWARGMDVSLREPDVSPLAVQGPKSIDLVTDLFGADVVDPIKYFHFRRGKDTVLDGDIPITLARSGWSPEDGFELYLEDCSKGARLWDIVMEAGEKYGITPGAPNQQRRVEAGMLSFGGDTLAGTNALELGLPKRMCDPFMKPDFVGKEALQRIAHREGGSRRAFTGIQFDIDAAFGATDWSGQHLPVYVEGTDNKLGYMTAFTHSPRFQRHLGLGFITKKVAAGTRVEVRGASGAAVFGGVTSNLPFKGWNEEPAGRGTTHAAEGEQAA